MNQDPHAFGDRVIPKCIHPRKTTGDNRVLLYEIFDFLKNKREEPMVVSIKVDLKKVYDHLEWTSLSL